MVDVAVGYSAKSTFCVVPMRVKSKGAGCLFSRRQEPSKGEGTREIGVGLFETEDSNQQQAREQLSKAGPDKDT